MSATASAWRSWCGGLMTGGTETLAATDDVESWGPVNAFFTEVVRRPGTAGRMARRALGKSASDSGRGDPGTGRRAGSGQPAPRPGRSRCRRQPEGLPDLVVAASGNLANIYFPGRADAPDPGGHGGAASGADGGPRVTPGHRLRAGAQRPVRAPSPSDARASITSTRTGWRVADPLAVFGPSSTRQPAPARLLRARRGHPGQLHVRPIDRGDRALRAPGGRARRPGRPAEQGVRAVSVGARGRPDPVSLVGAEAVNARIHAWMARARELDGATASVERSRPGIDPVVAQVMEPRVRARTGAEPQPSWMPMGKAPW